MEAAGIEPGPESSGNCGGGDQCGDRKDDFPTDLAAVVEAWPKLPEAIRAGILAMIRAAEYGGERSRYSQKVLPGRLRLATAGGTVARGDRICLPHHATGNSIMRTLASDGTADQLLDYLDSDGAAGTR
jgi:hypothetical protein